MKTILTPILFFCGLLMASATPAIEFDEVRNFEEVFVISGTAVARDRVEVSWAIEPDYYLYNNRFLKFASASEGVVLGDGVRDGDGAAVVGRGTFRSKPMDVIEW